MAVTRLVIGRSRYKVFVLYMCKFDDRFLEMNLTKRKKLKLKMKVEDEDREIWLVL